MKIKTKKMSYEDVLKLPKKPRLKPKRPLLFFRWLMKTTGKGDLKKANFSYKEIGMEKLSKNTPALFLMNHSSFIDLEIATNVLYPRPLNIVCTSDGFVGKSWLMKNLGCIPTQKFITDVSLVRDMVYATNDLGNSVLLYPEASYSFDGTATPLPKTLGKLIKLLGVPVVMIKTDGAFLRDPLYNMLQVRDVNVSATFEYVLSPADIENKTTDELLEIINQKFIFDNFRDQQKNNITVDAPFRADGLNRVLYKCPCCQTEGNMVGKGIKLTCTNCNANWELTENGYLSGAEFEHIPDWYNWERKEVRSEIEAGTYKLDIPVDIRVMADYKAIYEIGEGRLCHGKDGFDLVSNDGKLNYHHKISASYSLYADYFWYELGDVICIGDNKVLYYCFPKNKGDIVAKTRLATEELYKLKNEL